VVDHDGTIACCVDLLTEAAYHATVVNQPSIGIELYQGAAAELYAGQLHVRSPSSTGSPGGSASSARSLTATRAGPSAVSPLAGQDCVGVFGHRDVTDKRGAGDPGTEIFDLLPGRLRALGLHAGEDLRVWAERQGKLGVPQDGVPGPKTLAALLAAKQPCGHVGRATGRRAARLCPDPRHLISRSGPAPRRPAA
jgi:hypothetical protein